MRRTEYGSRVRPAGRASGPRARSGRLLSADEGNRHVPRICSSYHSPPGRRRAVPGPAADPCVLVQPSESFRVLRGPLLQHAAAVGAPPARPASAAHAPGGAEAPVSALSDEERALLGMLRERVPVGEMARRFYCSERSMYRRIRRVYEALGVANRKELCTRMPYGIS